MTTPEQIAALEKKAGGVLEALSACLKDAADRERPYRGTITCPACGGVLHYLAKTSARGTIWGACATPGCLSWMV